METKKKSINYDAWPLIIKVARLEVKVHMAVVFIIKRGSISETMAVTFVC